MASDLSEELFDQSCEACTNCCSTYDNVEMVGSTNIKKSKKSNRTKKSTRNLKKTKKAKTLKRSKRVKKVRKTIKPRTVKKTKKVKKTRKLVSVRPAKIEKKKAVTNKKTIGKDNRWLTKQLYGSSLAASALSPMTSYTNEKNELRVVINSLFTIDCALQFDAKAQPSLLSGCSVKSKNNTWKVKEKNIALNCSNTDISHTCKGNYTLMFLDNDDKNEAHKITIAIRK